MSVIDELEAAYADVVFGYAEPELIICKSWPHFIHMCWMCGVEFNPLIIQPQGPGFSVI